MGDAWSEDCAEGGLGHISSGHGLRRAASRPWNICGTEQRPGGVRPPAMNAQNGRPSGASAGRVAWHKSNRDCR